MMVFLILNYLAYKDTIECVDSIRENIDFPDKKIVIVDNGSKNNSYAILKDYFCNDNNIILLHSKTNEGFARGNNIGFKYAKDKLKAEFIVMINNDTIITQKNFCDVIIKKHDKYNFAVLGPDILTKDGVHQNPWKVIGSSKGQIIKYRMKQRLRILLSYVKLDSYIYRNLHKSDYIITAVKEDVFDVPLHGAALIFGPEYIKIFDGLDGRTFLYFEEEILRLYCKSYNLLMMYTADLQIYHKEDVSTNMAMRKKGVKERIGFRNRIKSSYVYEKVIKEQKV